MPPRKRTCCGTDIGKTEIVRASKDSTLGVCATCGKNWRWDEHSPFVRSGGQWQPAKLFVIQEMDLE